MGNTPTIVAAYRGARRARCSAWNDDNDAPVAKHHLERPCDALAVVGRDARRGLGVERREFAMPARRALVHEPLTHLLLHLDGDVGDLREAVNQRAHVEAGAAGDDGQPTTCMQVAIIGSAAATQAPALICSLGSHTSTR